MGKSLGPLFARLGFLNLRCHRQEIFTPGLAFTFGALINDVPNTEAVVAACSFIAWKFATLRTRIEGTLLSAAMLIIEHVFADDAHGRLRSGGTRDPTIYYIVQ